MAETTADAPAADAWPAPQTVLRPLPRGPHGLPRDVVVTSQRSRLLVAMVEVVADKGYPATTVADIIARAGVSRTTFYQQFKDKEDCFLVAYDRAAMAQYNRVVEAVETATDPLEQLRNNVRAYLAEMVAFPAFAQAFTLEVVAAGPRALAVRDRFQQHYVELFQRLYARFRERRQSLPELPVEVFRAATAAVDAMVGRWVRDGRVAELAELEPIAVYVELALFGLADAAAEALPGPTGAGGNG